VAIHAVRAGDRRNGSAVPPAERGHPLLDGRTYVDAAVVFGKTAALSPQACIRTGGGSATTGMTSLIRLECF
jgi:hypothetical protein